MMKEKIYCVSGYKPASYNYDTLSRGFICHCRSIKFSAAGVRLLSGKKYYITLKFRKKSTCKHPVKTKAYKFPTEDIDQECPFNIHFFIEYRHNVKKVNELIITLSKKVKGPAGPKVLGKKSISLESFIQSPHIDKIELYTKKNEKLAEISLLFIGTINMTKEMLLEWAKKSGSKLGGFDISSPEFVAPTVLGEDSDDDENEGEEEEEESESPLDQKHNRSKSRDETPRRKSSNTGTRPSHLKSLSLPKKEPGKEGEDIGGSVTPKSDVSEEVEEFSADGEKKKEKKSLGAIMSKAARGLMKKRKKGKRGSGKSNDGMKELRSQLGVKARVEEQFERILGEDNAQTNDEDAYSDVSEEDDDRDSDDSSDENKGYSSSGEEEEEDNKVEIHSGGEESSNSEIEGKNNEDTNDSDDDRRTSDEEEESESSEEEPTKKQKNSSSDEEDVKNNKKRGVKRPVKIPDQLVIVDSSEPRGAELASYLTRKKGVFRDKTLYVSKYHSDDYTKNNNDDDPGSPLKEVAARMYEVFKSGEAEVAKRIRLAVVGSDRFYSYFLRELLSSSQFSEEFFERLVFFLIPLVKPGEEEKRKITINEYMASVSPNYRRFFMGGGWTNAVRNLGFGKEREDYQKEQKKVAFMTVEKGIQHYFKNADESLKIPLSQVILTFSDTNAAKNEPSHLFVPLLSELVISRKMLDEEMSKKKKVIKSTKKKIKAEQKIVKKTMLNVKLDYFQMNNEKKLTLEKKRSQFHQLRISRLREGKHPNYLRKKGFKLSIISKSINKSAGPGEKTAEKKTNIDDVRKLICSMKEKKSVCEVDGFMFERYVKHIQVDEKHPSEQTLCVALFSDKQKHY